jgi:CDP-paratose 2-epimerase
MKSENGNGHGNGNGNGNGRSHSEGNGNGNGNIKVNLEAKRPNGGPRVGILEWFRPGEHERVEKVLADLKALGVGDLRTGFSWADWHAKGCEAWYDWLFPRLAREVELLPCFVYTPPSLGIAPKTSSPPRDPKAYADFLDVMVERYGEHFEWVELWNEPNNRREWDYTLDPEWTIFGEMIGGAAHWMKRRGKKTLLGGLGPMDPNWMTLMFRRGVMKYIDAVGVHGFPATYEFHWEGWEANLARMRRTLDENGGNTSLWITETGYSTGRRDERRQLKYFLEALEAPAERVYWYGAQDLDPALPTVDGFHSDEKEYHFGLRRADGSPKLLHRIWASGGLAAVRDASWMADPSPAVHVSKKARPVLITGGAGFIGTNVAHRIASAKRPVLIYDNLSRPGVEENLRWLRETHGDLVQAEIADVLDYPTLKKAVERCAQAFHFAAQVAVTTSLVNPEHDFLTNARGTLNLLEAARSRKDPPSIVFTSTNKVYGALDDLEVRADGSRYVPADPRTAARGVGEERGLDFHSPYGCSKGAADQYVLDYARSYGIPAVVFRMSCIYGPHQFGNEDQGWIAHFLIQTLKENPLIIYGDGKQVRDILYVEDLVDAMLMAQRKMPALAGQAFNIGGGPANTLSLLELLDLIHDLHGSHPPLDFQDWRTGDQKYYVSDTGKFQAGTEWMPQVGAAEGVERLYHWLCAASGKPAIRRKPSPALGNAGITSAPGVAITKRSPK